MRCLVRPQAADATIDWGSGPRRCAIGRAGIGRKQREGDGVTPIGVWPIRRALYRADRPLTRLTTALPLRTITRDDGWCDAPADPQYNRLVTLPYDASHENMWRQDRLYDIVVVLGFNDDPVIAGMGSAIFLHIAREGYAPTEGCIALALPDLVDLVRDATLDSVVDIAK